jgi:hypothetical protein
MEEAEAFCERYLAPRNWLRLAMAAFLSHSPAQFELMVQTRTDPASMPIDDATVRWSERRSPFRRVAMLTIPRQVFWPAAGMPPAILKATSAMMELGENMSFMPWHGLTDHEPLGDINDARRRIYADMSTYRRGQNQVTPPDPAADYNALRRVVQDGCSKPWTGLRSVTNTSRAPHLPPGRRAARNCPLSFRRRLPVGALSPRRRSTPLRAGSARQGSHGRVRVGRQHNRRVSRQTL